MMGNKRAVFLSGLVVILLVAAGCASPKEPAPRQEPALENNTCANIEGAVQDWVRDNADELSQRIGALVTANLPFARDIAAKAIEKALLTRLQLSIEYAEPISGTNKCSARVTLEFPLELQIPLVDKRGYRVSVQYDLILENGKVTAADIDLSSFQVTPTSG